jgi:CPA2 family monovalent cation:H+ antiporter-2
MAVFFTTVGLALDVRAFGEGGWQLILLGVISVVLIKTAAMGLTAWLFGATPAVAVIFGLALFQAGEFSVVLLSATRHQGLIDATGMSRLTVVVVMTLILTPFMFTLGHKLRPLVGRLPVAGWSKAGALRGPTRDEKKAAQREALSNEFGEAEGHAAPVPALANHVIIAGFGVVGRSIADRLEVAKQPFCIVDLNQATVATQQKLGRYAVYGDISNPEVLEGVGVEHASGIALTIPDDEATLRACRVIRTLSPHVFIAARTSFLSKAMAAQQLGADHVTVEEVATAEAMARHVMDRLVKKK